MLRDDCRVLVLPGTCHRCRSETDRRHVSAELEHGRLGRRAGALRPELGSRRSPAWQNGKPKCRPAFGRTFSSSFGTSSPSPSRPFSVNQSSRGHRMPGEPNGVAHAVGEHLHARAIGLHPHDRRVPSAATDKHCTARRPTCRACRPARRRCTSTCGRPLGSADRSARYRRGRRIEMLLDVVVAQEPAGRRNVQAPLRIATPLG